MAPRKLSYDEQILHGFVMQFMNHKNFGKVALKNGKFKDTDGRVYKGITTVLSNHVWSGELKLPSRRAETTTPIDGVVMEVGSAEQGKMRGQIIHREIQQYFNGSYGTAARSRSQRLVQSNRIIDKLQELKLMPLGAELVVANHPVATALDFACVHASTSRLYACEMKTGYRGVFNHWDGQRMMRFPVGLGISIEDTALNRAMVQLAITVMLLKFNYEMDIPRTQCIVFHTTDADCVAYVMQESIYEARAQIYSFFHSCALGVQVARSPAISLPGMVCRDASNTGKSKRAKKPKIPAAATLGIVKNTGKKQQRGNTVMQSVVKNSLRCAGFMVKVGF